MPCPPTGGQYVSFGDVDAHPRPVRPGGPRVVIGGHSPAAYRRAIARGHGWFGNGTAAELATHLSGLAAAATEIERPARLGRLEIIYMQLDPIEVTADAARRYADLGVDRLLVYPLPIESERDVAAFLERHASLPC
ncbi:LLM class flavin-dependent oxidoreductase [Candidatus Protofrankia datiscae]|uniref:LLM class flavin-dependent oxidoreductase n=1 Tax=Candidatus Protofrankia datiscae TaxID=2716812 RepID=UPI002407C77A|nr:LLM class flavin-dependent oxidoreductase [Candidatus Protofrankia datiscae]